MAAVIQNSKEGGNRRKNYYLDPRRKEWREIRAPKIDNRIPHYTDAGVDQMIQTIQLSDFRTAFYNMGRKDQFTYEGLGLIFEYIEDYERDNGERVELDVIALCCEWSELSPEDILDQYSTDIDTEGKDADEIAAEVEEYLLNETQFAGRTTAGDFVFVQF
jgi:hypothetical protein